MALGGQKPAKQRGNYAILYVLNQEFLYCRGALGWCFKRVYAARASVVTSSTIRLSNSWPIHCLMQLVLRLKLTENYILVSEYLHSIYDLNLKKALLQKGCKTLF